MSIERPKNLIEEGQRLVRMRLASANTEDRVEGIVIDRLVQEAERAERLEDEIEKLRANRQCRHGWRGSPITEAIVTPCPTCGLRSLFIGSGGHLTCASVPSDLSHGCPEPVVEDAIEKLKTRINELQTELETERGREP